VSSYLDRGVAATLSAEFADDDELPCALTSVAIRDLHGELLSRPRRDQPFVVDLGIRVRAPTPGLDMAIWLLNETGARVIDEDWSDAEPDRSFQEPGDYRVAVSVPPVLPAGRYTLGVWLRSQYQQLMDDEVLTLEVAPRPDDTTEMVERTRLVQPPVSWSVQSSRL
jgi:hypothetical protein